jgi:uncharacterized protein DUF1116
MIERVIVHHDRFHDPITLMEVSERVRTLDDVAHVAVGMGDPLNLYIIGGRHGYDLDGNANLGPNDLVIAVRAESEQAGDAAIEAIERHLADRGGSREVAAIGSYEYAADSRGPEAIERMTWEAAPAAREAELARLEPHAERIAEANDRAVQRMQEARPLIVGVGTAGDVLPGMTARTFLHAGPPIEWPDMSGPLRGAIIAAALFEGLASDPEDAVRKAERGKFEFAPGHEHAALGPMAGVITASMPVWIVENVTLGNRAHCTFSEGLGGPFRFGAYDESVIERLHWIRSVLARVVAATLERLPRPIDLRATNAQALEMGDEVHNRPVAGSSLLFRALAPTLFESGEPSAEIAEVAHYLATDTFFYLNLSMVSGKATADAAAGIDHSTIVTAMARNGTRFGLRVSGTGDRWFTAPSSEIRGVYLPGYRREDANRDMGDSTITETIGLGGFSWAAAPAIIHFAGIAAEDALRASLAMYEITWAESINYRLPALGYRGSPLGIDCRKVVATGILPVADTGVAHREPGVGIIGGGVVRPPMEPFAAAVKAIGDAL